MRKKKHLEESKTKTKTRNIKQDKMIIISKDVKKKNRKEEIKKEREKRRKMRINTTKKKP